MKSSAKASAARHDLLSGFARLLLGHFRRFRDVRLQEIAIAWISDPSPASDLLLRLTNGTIALRALCIRLYIYARIRYSRFVFAAKFRNLHFCGAAAAHQTKSLLCPTRGRPTGVARFVSSVARTARRPELVEILLYVDDDDPTLAEYRSVVTDLVARFPSLGRLECVVGPAAGVAKAWNALANACSGDLLIMANDDQMYADYGWDEVLDKYASRFPDGVFAVFFHAGQDAEGATDFPIVSRVWYERLGYYCPELFNFWFNEAWIFDLANRLGRIWSIPGIFVQHFHYQDYTARFDATYRRHRMDSSKSLRDRELWEESTADRVRDAGKLRQLLADRP